jgi:predicted MPP superfamily phosphohydrolase
MPFVFAITPVFLLFLGAQVYWILQFRVLCRRLIKKTALRRAAGLGAAAVYLSYFAVNILSVRAATPSHMTLRAALVTAPFLWWIFSSTIGFLVVLLIWLVRLLAFVLQWPARFFRKPRSADGPVSPARRQFLERTASVAAAAPFVAGAYGLLWGRLNLQVTRQSVRLARLPRAFHGFRIAQLSDIHIGPFMSEDEIRKYVAIANQLKPDLVVLTGDFVTWVADPEQAVVTALSGLKAPFGVYGCLGNHDAWAGAEDSITGLFAQCGVNILRQARAPLRLGGESINLMGIDFANSRHMSAGQGHMSSLRLEGVPELMAPETVNILLSHNPETFDRAAELGIDLSLAGHTHGGQLALEFISPELAPSRIVTPYVAGLFQQPGGQLYVNRGIGTIAAPMRVGAPPEITLFELVRG